MKLNYIIMAVLICVANFGISQRVGVNTTSPHAAAALDIVSQSKGLLVPRMTKNERQLIASPLNALLVYQTDSISGFYFYDVVSSSWKMLAGSATKIQDADGNTQIQTEKNPNENIIRFEINGTEKMALVKNISSTISRLPIISNQGNISIGDSLSQNSNASAIKNIAIGTSALGTNINGSGNIAVGNKTLNTFNENNSIGIGFESLKLTDANDFYNTAIGYKANTFGGGDRNVMIGSEATPSTGTFSNIGIGKKTNYIGLGTGNILIGDEAMYNATTTDYNTGIGFRALYNNDLSNLQNAHIGADSGNRGNKNIGIGYKSFSLNYSDENIALGSYTLTNHTSGNYNNALGFQAMYHHNSGLENIALGSKALYNNTSKNQNIAAGYQSLYHSTGQYNVAIGFNAQNISNDTSSYNVVIGANSQNDAAPGNGNVIIGQNAEVAAGVINSVVLGKDAYTTQSNTIILGSVAGVNGATTTVQVGLGTSNPHHSAIFEAKSATKAFEIPTTGYTLIQNPPEGLLIHHSDRYYFHNGTAWKDMNEYELFNADGAMIDETFVYRNGNIIKGYTNAILSKDLGFVHTSKATIEETENENKFRLKLHDVDVLNMRENANGQLIMETPNNEKNIYFGIYDISGGVENTILSSNNNQHFSDNNTIAGNYTFTDAGIDRVGLGNGNFYNGTSASSNVECVAVGLSNGLGMDGEGLTLVGTGSYTSGLNLFQQHNTLIGDYLIAYDDADRATGIGEQVKIQCDDCVLLGREKNYSNEVEYQVGIGTTDPTAALEIAGVSSSSNPQLKLERPSNNDIILDFDGSVAGSNLSFIADPNSNTNNADFRFGHTTNGALMTLLGNGDASLTSLLQLSDATLKEKIYPINDVLSKLKEISPVSYNWSDEKKSGTHIGVIAQDVNNSFPELVKKDDQENLTVNYAGINAVLWQGLKEINEQMEINERRYNEQLAKIEALKMKVKEMKGKQRSNSITHKEE